VGLGASQIPRAPIILGRMEDGRIMGLSIGQEQLAADGGAMGQHVNMIQVMYTFSLVMLHLCSVQYNISSAGILRSYS
jgi:hypothetical protein